MKTETEFQRLLEGSMFTIEIRENVYGWFLKLQPEEDVPFNAVSICGADKGKLYSFDNNKKVYALLGNLQLFSTMQLKKPSANAEGKSFESLIGGISTRHYAGTETKPCQCHQCYKCREKEQREIQNTPKKN